MEIKNTLQKMIDPYKTRIETNTAGAQSNARATQTAQTPAAQGERVSVSPEAKLRAEIYTVASNTESIRQEKVDALKERVQSGTYTINSRDIAKKLISQESLLRGTIKD